MSLLADPLESEDFDPVSYINERFPTESSLDDLDLFAAEISKQIAEIDDEISEVVQMQSLAGRQLTKEVSDAHSHIEDLFSKITDIKTKASESESMVHDLCADIKKLDCAKNHLQTSITALNRLQMLMSAVNQLELLAAEMHYKDAANLLDAVRQFMSHFEPYKHITVIYDLNNRIDNICDYLTRKIKQIFTDLSQNIDTVADGDLALPSIPGGLKTVADSCLVVDALGPAVKKSILEDFVRRQLNGYENIFGEGKEHFSLDDMERRWAWFKRLLRYIDSKFKPIFPVHWRIQLRLCLEFVERTKMHLILLLTEFENNEQQNNVQTLLKALDSSLRFEREMADKFNLLKELKESQARDEATARTRAQDLETEKRLKKDDKIMYIPTDHDAENREDETESGFLGLAHTAISGGLSGVFDKFLGSYIAYERQQLEDLLLKMSKEEDVANEEEDSHSSSTSSKPLNVYQSSTNMFLFIKKSIARCVTLTTGQSFLALTEEFQQCMLEYISLLKSRCPPEMTGSLPIPVFKLPPNGEVTMAYLINTGEYCAETVPQLQQMIQQKINSKLSNKVDFSSVEDAFMDLVAHCLKVLVYGVMDRLEPNFRTMQNTNWGTFDSVGEESAYLHACNSLLIETIPKIREAISSSYFNNFCTKLSTEILTRFLDGIVKQKRISDHATQQLLLDTYNLKTLLLHLPTLTPELSINKTAPATGMYAKLINNKTAHIETILKLIGTPDDMLIDRFKIMWPDGQSKDLQMVMALKGTKKQDQQMILETLGLTADATNKNNGNTTANKLSNMFGGTSTLSPTTTLNSAASTFAATTAATTAASAAAFSSVKSLTQDISSSARNALGNLKLSTNK